MAVVVLVSLFLPSLYANAPQVHSTGEFIQLAGVSLKHGDSSKGSSSSSSSSSSSGGCRRTLVYESSTHCCPGFGSQINMLLLAHMLALATQRQLVWQARYYSWGCPTDGSDAPSMDEENCLFEPSACTGALPGQATIANCLLGKPLYTCGTVRGDKHGESVATFFGRPDAAVVVGSWEVGTLFNELIDYRLQHSGAPVCVAPLSRPRAAAVCNALLTNMSGAALAKARWLSLFRLTARRVFAQLRPSVLQLVRARLHDASWRGGRGAAPLSEGFVAFHMRRGDKVGEAGYQPPTLKAYMAAAEAAGMLGPQTQVFIATDDQYGVLAETKMFPRRHFAFMASAGARVIGGHTEARFNKQVSAKRFSEHITVLAELRLIAQADLFVCVFASKLALLAEVLRGEVGVVAPWGMSMTAWPRQEHYRDHAIDLDSRQEANSTNTWYPGG